MHSLDTQTTINRLRIDLAHWKCNHAEMVRRLRRYTCRPDLTINKLDDEIILLKARIKMQDKLLEDLQYGKE